MLRKLFYVSASLLMRQRIAALFVATMLLPAALRAAPVDPPPDFVEQWRTSRDMAVYGIAVDRHSVAYCVDLGSSIEAFSWNGTWMFGWVAVNPITNVMAIFMDVAVAADGHAFGVGAAHAVPYGVLWEFAPGNSQPVRYGPVSGMPTLVSVAVLNDSTLLIAGRGDLAGNGRIFECARDGAVRRQWGAPMQGELDIAVSLHGEVFVADAVGAKVWVYTSEGALIRTWGTPGAGEGQFSFPHGIAVDRAGNVYVADTGNGRVQKFASDGMFLCHWGGNGSPPEARLASPYAIEVDPLGRILVSDHGARGLVRVFQYSVTSSVHRSWGRIKTLFR